MFDIGFPELVLVAVVGLLILGPERLPEALRTLGLWLGRLRRSFTAVKAEIEKEIGMDDIKRQLHNEAVMEEMKRLEREVKGESILKPLAEKTAHTDEAKPDASMPDSTDNHPTDNSSDSTSDSSSDTSSDNPGSNSTTESTRTSNNDAA